jgi:aconitate hydratase
MTSDSFVTRDLLTVDDMSYSIYRLDRVEGADRLPYSLKVLLENLLRNEDGHLVTENQISALAGWDPRAEHGSEVQFTPARVLMQDFTGVPCVVDLVAMRDAITELGGDPQRINPLIPTELVIDHSVIADVFARPDAFRINAALEFERNAERYQLLRWAQEAFADFQVVPPDTGICHQVNLEYLARVVFTRDGPSGPMAYPDTLVGTDSHTPMVNGLGVLGWGVGGIEAEAAMLGQPMSMLIPQVLGLKLTGELPPGTTATDLVLTVAELLRRTSVVGKFVEFYGPGVARSGPMTGSRYASRRMRSVRYSPGSRRPRPCRLAWTRRPLSRSRPVIPSQSITRMMAMGRALRVPAAPGTTGPAIQSPSHWPTGPPPKSTTATS